MKLVNVFYFLCLLCFLQFNTTSMYAQCGKVMTKEDRLHYHEHLENFKKSTNGLKSTAANDWMSVPITIHVINKDDGTGGSKQTDILRDLQKLNAIFYGAKIKFYICGNIDYVNATARFDYSDTVATTNLPSSYDVLNTINVIYYHSLDLKGFGKAGGFASFPGGSLRIYMSQSSDEYTLAHEMGHFWGLPHTFEGSESNDLAVKELVTRGTGANCSTAGDAICDTPADPYIYKTSKGYFPKCIYTDTLYDANHDQYKPMIENIMSYYNGCDNQLFTLGQYNVIKSYKTSQYRTNWATNCLAVNAPTNLTAVLDSKYGIKLSWNDNATNELGYELEVSVGNNTDFKTFLIVPANTTLNYFGDLSPFTTYYFRVKPLNAADTYSNIVNISTQKSYCVPMNATNCEDPSFILNGSNAPIGIAQVNIEAENNYTNTSTCGLKGYDFFNAQTIKIYKGIPYSLNISTLKKDGSGEVPNIRCWIDLNDDGTFDETTEKINVPDFTYSVLLNIKTSVTSGIKRLRIRAVNSNSEVSPCGYSYLGETEDYLLDVQSFPTSFPVQLSATYPNLYNADLTWTYSTLPANTKCLIYASQNGQGYKFLDTVLLSQVRYATILGKNGVNSFFLRKADDRSIISNIASVTVNNITYCVPTNDLTCTLPSDHAIEKVEILGETILNNTTGCSPQTFSYYPTNVTKLYKGINYMINVTQSKKSGGWGLLRASAWIDFNNNGSFEDAGEKFPLENKPSSSIYTGSLLVPSTASIGVKTLRARLHYYTSTTSCSNDYEGETEDYLVEIVNLPTSFLANLSVSQKSVYSTNLTWTYSGIPSDTKCYLYKSVNDKAFTKVDSMSIGQLNLTNLLTSNGAFKYMIRKAADNTILSNIASIDVTNFTNPYQLSATILNNVVRLSWNNNNIISRGILYRAYNNYLGYFAKLDTIDIAKGYYDDIRIYKTDTAYTYYIKTLAGDIVSNQANINIKKHYCTPNFTNSECLANFNSFVFSPISDNSSVGIMFNPYCYTNGNQFSEPYTSSVIDTLYPNKNYNFYVYAENNCTNNQPVSNFRNVSIWLDMNENQVFDANELLYTNPANTYLCYYNFTYTLPVKAEGGLKRLRYIITDKNYKITDPCGTYTYGTGFDKFVYIKTPDLTSSLLSETFSSLDQITIYPNPSDNGRFTIQSNDKVSQIRVFNDMGVLVYAGDPAGLNVSLPKGLYIIDIATRSGLDTQKIKFISE